MPGGYDRSRSRIALMALILAATPAAAPAVPSAPSAEKAGRAASRRPGPGRLPEEIAPTSYDLHLAVDPREPRFSGEVTIGLDVRSPVYTIPFHSEDLAIQSAVVTSGERELRAVISAAAGAGAEPDHGEMMATLTETLPAGPAKIRFVFDGPFNRNLAGLYSAKDEAGRWYAYTQFETADARRAFPCFDEPRFKTPFRIELTIPDGMTAVANTLEASRESREGRTKVVFRETKPLPTYLVAFLVGDLDIVPGPATSTPLRGIAARGKGAMLADSLRVHAEILPILEAYFGRPYPFDKLDAAALVEYAAGAMENAGLITYREEALLVDPGTTSLGRRRRVDNVIAHEMAHEWFGDLVTMPWWNDIWLNESFATWMAAKAVDAWHPDSREGESLLARRETAFSADENATARAVRQPVNGLLDAESAFDSLSYTKGANVILMMERWMGEETFRDGIRKFLGAHAYGNATAEDLFAALAEVSGKDVSRVARSFLDRPGVPVVAAELTCAPGARPTVALSQSRYRPLGSSAPAAFPEGGPWSIPICVAYPVDGGVGRTCALLVEERGSFPLEGASRCPEWIHPDAGEFGYYRWSVPKSMASKLGAAVEASWRPGESAGGEDPAVRSRLALLDQAWAMVASGQGDLDAFLALLSTLSTTGERRVMEQVVGAVTTLAATWEDLAREDSFRAYVRGMLDSEGLRLGWDPKAGESADDGLERPRILEALGRYGRSPWVLDGAAGQAKKYLAEPSSVTPEIAGTALTLSASEGKIGPRDLEGLLATARTPSQRTNALAGLAALPPGDRLAEALDFSLTDAVRIQDLRTIVFDPLRRPESRSQAFEFIRKRFDEIVRRMPGGFAATSRLPALVRNFCSGPELEAARRFFEEKKLEGGAKSLARGIEEANQCIALQASGREKLAGYLQGRSPAAH